MAKNVILDMDTGVDDALAIMLALNSPELDVKAITVSAGNVDMEQCVMNTVRVSHYVRTILRPDLDLPIIAKGKKKDVEPPNAADVHGTDGLGGISETLKFNGEEEIIHDDAGREIRRILEEAVKEDRKVTLVTTGPLTNPSDWIDEFPDLLYQGIDEIICMGGAFFTCGNRTATAEFNIYSNPEAAAKVLRFCRGDKCLPSADVDENAKEDVGIIKSANTIPITFVGLDVTHKVALRRSVLIKLRKEYPNNENLKIVTDMTNMYMDFYNRNEFHPGCPLHDPLAVGMAIDPSFCERKDFHVEIEISPENYNLSIGIARGMTVVDNRPTRLFKQKERETTLVCTNVDSERFEKFFLDRVLGL